MDPEAFDDLRSAEGQRLLAAVAEHGTDETDLLATATALRSRYPADLVGAALTQVRLRRRAVAKFGGLAHRMYFTPDGLEQATHPAVAAHRAERFGTPSGSPLADLCCGIGGDLIALARAGHSVEGIEQDPLTAAVARANIAALGLADCATTRRGDATDPRITGDLPRFGGLFWDPARRTGHGGTRRRVFAPDAYEPPLPRVLELSGEVRGACVKVAPGIPHEAVPENAEAEWVSWRGDLKEASLWIGDLAGVGVRRRATVLSPVPPGEEAREHPGRTGHAGRATLTADPGRAPTPVRPPAGYLYEPDDAVVRAHLVGEVAARVDGALIDPRIAYVTAGSYTPTPFASAYAIDDVLAFSVKRLRATLRERGVGSLTIKKRGSAVDIERLRRDLRPSGSAAAVLVLTRAGKQPLALLCTALSTRPSAAP